AASMLVPAAGGAAPAAASGTICVALVVDATSLGGRVSTGCVTVPKGSTGATVLQKNHRVTYRSDGLICAIDGRPKSGCKAVDDSHYWAYFHRSPGSSSWTYSTAGSGSYRPANRSTEGWVYDDGTSRQP